MVTGKGEGPGPDFAISMMALPDVCVIWYLEILQLATVLILGRCELRLGDHLPTTWVEFQELESLFPIVGTSPGVTPRFRTSTYNNHRMMWLRFPVQAQGRRVVLGINQAEATGCDIQATLIVSSIPKEVPDCLLSV